MFWRRKPKDQRKSDDPTVGGDIAAYGLEKWWLSTFTEEERRLIVERYKPLGAGDDYSLISGPRLEPHDPDDQQRSATKFLTNLAGWFKRKDDIHIGLRILEKAHEPNMPPVDEHFYWMQYIGQRYKERTDDPDAIDDVIAACERMIAMAPQVAEDFEAQHETSEDRMAEIHARIGEKYEREPFPGLPPANPFFKRLIIIRKKQKNFEEAERLEELFEEVWGQHTMGRKRAE